MADNPINLALRFLLELAALLAMGYWGWQQVEGGWRWILALGIPALAAVLWGVFRIPNDPGPAPVAVPGIVRLALELAFFAFAIWALNDAGAITLSWIMGLLVAVHYLASYDRLMRMVKKEK